MPSYCNRDNLEFFLILSTNRTVPHSLDSIISTINDLAALSLSGQSF